MADTAANLVDFVLPNVGVRQWVLSLPFSLRYRLGYDRTLLTPVLGAFMRAVFRSYRRRAFQRHGATGSKCGAVVFIQRFGEALNLNVHFHALVLEGAYEVPPSNNHVRFLPLPAPTDDDVREVMADTARRIGRQLASRRSLSSDEDEFHDPDEPTDRLAREDPLLARLYACSVEGRVPTGRRAGLQSERQGAVSPKAWKEKSPPPLCAVGHGLSLHAGVYIPGSDRERLERVCRYTGRPPLAIDRLSKLSDGRIRYRLRHPCATEQRTLCLSPPSLWRDLPRSFPRRAGTRYGTTEFSRRLRRGETKSCRTQNRHRLHPKLLPTPPNTPSLPALGDGRGQNFWVGFSLSMFSSARDVEGEPASSRWRCMSPSRERCSRASP